MTDEEIRNAFTPCKKVKVYLGDGDWHFIENCSVYIDDDHGTTTVISENETVVTVFQNKYVRRLDLMKPDEGGDE